jgi:hypothetical protein
LARCAFGADVEAALGAVEGGEADAVGAGVGEDGFCGEGSVLERGVEPVGGFRESGAGFEGKVKEVCGE